MGQLGSTAPPPPEQYETIFKNIHDAVYMLDSEGEITWVNEVAFEEFDVGYSRDELTGAPVSEVLSQEDISKCAEIITNILESDERDSGRCEVKLQTAFGGEIPCDLRLAPLLSNQGEFEGTIGVLRDITERKQREEGLMVLNRVLRHNLRNRLNVIMGRAEFLKNNEGVNHPHLEAILEAAWELDSLGTKARRAGSAISETDWSLERVDLVKVIKHRAQILEQEYPEIELSMELPSKAPIRGDQRLGLAIRNVIDNTIEHSDQESPRVKISIENGNKNWVEIRVADEGSKIPKNELRAIQRGEETPLEHGSGLGLWLAKWIVERCSGELGFEELESEGSVVIIRLRTLGS